MVMIVIPGEPVAQGRPCFTRTGRAYDPTKSRNYKALVRQFTTQAVTEPPISGPVRCEVKMFRSIQKAGSSKLRAQKAQGVVRPVVKPDVDNVFKAVTDAMKGIVWLDDNQIVEAKIEKFYSDTPRVEVVVEAIKEDKT
ncbi:RusA family crossover junction endodeoxyribonuclease [Lacticaseibacillus mingshuiensis]|uniref:RusA family crossover junction endodeoxyribonuclease n=1 Tax=Lacticaseibacillus mingshuiensis TaxID=2799574 RepID=A0ABW4CLV0_9LACO|nr:RusA family crossover junction endodeoxyribonuclease [Lacticaseibacillus mingshuiensis]